MSKSDITAGRAFVELLLKGKEKFIGGIRESSQLLKDFGGGAMMAGGMVMAAGSAMLAPFVAATATFLTTADALDKMRQRTGMTVEELSALNHAAKQSDASLDDLGKAAIKNQKNITEAAAGSKSLTEAYENLGLSVKDLEKMSADEQFDAVAKAVGKIEDPAKKSAAAMEVFGKGGVKLLPMIEDLDALKQEARDMGLVMSGPAAAAGVKLGDTMANVWERIEATGNVIAEALVPYLQTGVELFDDIVESTTNWIRENKDLFVSIAAVAGGLVVAGGAIMGIGALITAGGFALGGIATGLSLVASVVGAVLSPIGLVTAGVVGLITLWATYTESGQKTVTTLVEGFQWLSGVFMQTWGGISDAIAAGDWALAGEIAMAALEVIFRKGLNVISDLFGESFGKIAEQLLGGDFSGAWETAITNMAAVWDGFVEGIVAVFTNAARAITDVWLKTTTMLADFILEDASKGGILGTAAMVGSGMDVEKIKKDSDLLDVKRREGLKVRREDLEERLATSERQGGRSQNKYGDWETSDELRSQIADVNESLGINVKSFMENGRDSIDAQLGSSAAAVKAKLDEMNRNAQANTQGSNAAANEANKSGNNEALTAAEARLNELRNRAASARQTADETVARVSKEEEDAADLPAAGAMKNEVFGSFSAAALLGGVGGGSPADRAAKASEEMLKEQRIAIEAERETKKELIAMRKAIEAMGVMGA